MPEREPEVEKIIVGALKAVGEPALAALKAGETHALVPVADLTMLVASAVACHAPPAVIAEIRSHLRDHQRASEMHKMADDAPAHGHGGH